MPHQQPSITDARFNFAPGQIIYTAVNNAVGRVAGIYRLHLLDEQGQFRSIPRLLDLDTNGILYIGTGIDLPRRASEVHKAVSVIYNTGQWVSSRHGLLASMSRLSRFTQTYSVEQLCMTVEPFTPQLGLDGIMTTDHYAQEKLAKDSYRCWFGEFPPFNSL